CFIIEERLKQLLDIPVFHDDQHGTAIIAAAGLINAIELTGRDLKTTKLVVNGAGAAGIACLDLLVAMGRPRANVTFCDTKGVIYQGRKEGMNQWKSGYAAKTKARTLADALDGADAFFGLSAKGAVTPEMVKSMAKNPIIFAMANPDPEITPEEVAATRSDAIVATGRSDYPNQINNVLGFPFIFRGALDVRASTINTEMKIAAAKALAELARAEVPDQVAAAFHGRRPTFGPDYIIPAPFDPRLITNIPPAVAKAAIETGVARKPIDINGYVARLSGRLDPVAGWLQSIFGEVRKAPRGIVFTEGEEDVVVRAANAYLNLGFGTPTLVGRSDRINTAFKNAGIKLRDGIRVINARESEHNAEYADYLYQRLQRRGFLRRDCQRMVNQDRNVFAACMVALGHADGMITGVTRNWTTAFTEVSRVLDVKAGHRVIGVSIAICRGRTVLVADTSVVELPTGQELAEIAIEAARVARRFGMTPRVAMLAYANFGNPPGERSQHVRDAVALLDQRGVDFEYEGEMAADVALNKEAMKLFPFCRLSDTANVLVMPAFHSASISTKLLQELGGATIVGPMLVGLSHSVQICPLGAKDSDIVNMAALAAYNVTP
ncbi:MAG TPA: phosphate acyltransferase, partial [Hyphomicrobiaceae bacterium]|nr:phosphate acyltransferase [Hyphomicrobiaceae bacterium]